LSVLFTFRLAFQGGKIEVLRFLSTHRALADACLLLLEAVGNEGKRQHVPHVSCVRVVRVHSRFPYHSTYLACATSVHLMRTWWLAPFLCHLSKPACLISRCNLWISWCLHVRGHPSLHSTSPHLLPIISPPHQHRGEDAFTFRLSPARRIGASGCLCAQHAGAPAVHHPPTTQWAFSCGQVSLQAYPFRPSMYVDLHLTLVCTMSF
jgi:hypothetical protein